VVKRSKGASAIAKAAYNSRSRLTDERTGEVKNYSRKAEPVLCSFTWAPPGAADHFRDRQQLWNVAEAAETRKNSQLAREIEISLPHELNQQQREWLLKDFVRENFVRAGMVADVNMHGPHPDGDQRNVHAHILLTTRRIEGDEFSKDKAREWNSKALYNEWREDWAERGAKALERAGFDVEAERWRYGHLTNREQQLHAIERGDMEFAQTKGREPSKHLGPEIKEILNRGLVSDVQERREAEAANDNAIRDELAALRAERAGLEREEAKLLREIERPQPQPKGLGMAQGEIRLAYTLSQSAEGFQEALAERGFWLARTDVDDVQQSKFEQGRAESHDRYSSVLEFGQYVAVDTFGRVFTLGQDATGDSRREVEKFLSPLDSVEVPSVIDTREEFKAQREACEIDTTPSDRPGFSRAPRAAEGVENVAGSIESGASILGAIGGKVLDSVSEGLESLLGMAGDAVSPTKPSPELTKARAADRAEQAERRAEAEQVDWRRALADDDYRRQVVQREREEREQRERDEYRTKDQ
jgi:hypothetical protein